MLYTYMTLHIKFERNRVSGEQDIFFQKLPNFLHIFLLRTAFEEFLNHIKTHTSELRGQEEVAFTRIFWPM